MIALKTGTHRFEAESICRAAGLLLAAVLFSCQTTYGQDNGLWIGYEGGEGPGNGRHIVLVSGDDEYRSEEAMPMMARILSEHHGFKTTVLFAIDPETGEIKPDYQTNIPGLEHLQDADLMILFTRFRELPDEQMRYFHDYIQAGKPVVGIRTATHSFDYSRNPDSIYSKYTYTSDLPGWEGGFGKRVLGETWIAHHGDHGSEGTRGVVDGIMERKGHPILRGVSDIWGPTDVYVTTEFDKSDNVDVLLWGLSTNGMTSESPVNWMKSVMPVAWTKTYTSEEGNTGRVFTTTMGSSLDFQSEDLRRLLVNASYWAIGMEEALPEKSNADIVGEYNPTMFGFGNFTEGLRPEDYK